MARAVSCTGVPNNEGGMFQDDANIWCWGVEKKVVGTGGNRSPSIARMVWDIGTSLYSSPKAFPSLQSDDFNVLSSLAASADPSGA